MKQLVRASRVILIIKSADDMNVNPMLSTRCATNGGFMPILIAIGIVSMLATMSLVTSISSGLVNKKKVERVNRYEGFYAAEILAWHAFERVDDGLVVSGEAVAIDNANLIRRYDPARVIAKIGNAAGRCGQVG